MRHQAQAFTLIELLVVITIIVVLLALLAPAMDRAMYQAELAVCAANHHATVNGALSYASDFNRRYPHRPGHNADQGNQPHRLKNTDARNPFDDRQTFRNHFNLRALVCPLTRKIDLDEGANRPGTQLWATYYMWFGFRFNRLTHDQGMFKLGDRFTFSLPTQTRFNVLTSPHDIFWPAQNNVNCSHPDYTTGAMMNGFVQDQPINGVNHTLSQWQASNSSYNDPRTPVKDLRGPVDANYGHDDGSVLRLNDVVHEDPRLEKVPGWANGMGWGEPVYTQLPPAQ